MTVRTPALENLLGLPYPAQLPLNSLSVVPTLDRSFFLDAVCTQDCDLSFFNVIMAQR